jgi:RNA polymerase sigma factor (sigma-70 family)
MEKVKNGDLDKLGLLFERYKRPLFGFFYGINKDPELSEDLVQNVFVRILKYRTLYRGEGEFRSWLFHIARNVSHDQYKKKKINASDSLEAWEERIGSDENRMTAYDKEDDLELLAQAMDRLSEEKREILLLSKYQEKKYKEIGEQLGITEGSVKVKVFRAMQELKSIYHQLELKR